MNKKNNIDLEEKEKTRFFNVHITVFRKIALNVDQVTSIKLMQKHIKI